MTPDEVADFVADRKTLMVASIGRDGLPHLVPMWYVPRDGGVAFWTYRKAQKVVNLRRDPRLTCLVESGDSYEELRGVSMQGAATLVEDYEAVRRIGQAILERYAGPLDPAVRPAFEAGVAAQAHKRVAVIFHPDRITSWDHRKLAGTY